MGIFRLQNNTPEPYVNKSRDFQMFCRAFDCINAGIRSEVDSMPSVLNTDLCVNRVIQLLQTKLGFFTIKEYNDDDVRLVLSSFATLIKNKGTKKAIVEAVYVFLRINKIISNVYVDVDHSNKIISIQIEEAGINDTSLLEEILSYVIPTGFVVTFLTGGKAYVDSQYVENNNAFMVNVGNVLNAQVANQSRDMNDWNGGSISTPSDEYSELVQMVGSVEIPTNSDTSTQLSTSSADDDATSEE